MFFKKKKRSLKDDLKVSCEWVVEALCSSNYEADYSIESLKEIDRFLVEENTAKGILSKNRGAILFALGAYVGEVFIKKYGGEWITDDNDRNGEMNVSVHLDTDITFMPVMSVMKAYENPNESSLYALAVAIEQNS